MSRYPAGWYSDPLYEKWGNEEMEYLGYDEEDEEDEDDEEQWDEGGNAYINDLEGEEANEEEI